MSMHQFHEDTIVNSIIGEGTRFRGNIELNGLLRIDGDFTGTIRTEGKVLIGKHGRAECNIIAHTVVIGGMVHGTVSATAKLIILSTAMVIGDVYSPSLTIEEGGILQADFAVYPDVKHPKQERNHLKLALPLQVEQAKALHVANKATAAADTA